MTAPARLELPIVEPAVDLSRVTFRCLALHAEMSVGACGARHRRARSPSMAGGGREGKATHPAADARCGTCPVGRQHAPHALKPQKRKKWTSFRAKAIESIDANRHAEKRERQIASPKPRKRPKSTRTIQRPVKPVPPGKEFGRWTVLREIEPRLRPRSDSDKPKVQRLMRCRCACGREYDVLLYKLTAGQSEQCKPCAADAARRTREARRG